MPVIVFASPKGGAGKTTSALVLAQELSKQASVTLLDADPNKPLSRWSKDAPSNARFMVRNADEDTILDMIEMCQADSDFVIVDLEGSASKIVLLAVSQADLVLIPLQGSVLDANQAGRALGVIKQQERMSRRNVPHAVLFTRTNPVIRERSLKRIMGDLVEHGVQILNVEMHQREAFKAIFEYASYLDQLDPEVVPGLEKAKENAAAFAYEVQSWFGRV